MQRASQLINANTLIRFIGYIPQPGVSDEAFIAAWRKEVEQVPQPAGLIYRDLCLVEYRPQAGVAEEKFIGAWSKGAEQASQPTDLSQRKPADLDDDTRKRLAAQDTQNPIPYDFVDYTLLQPDQDPAELPTLPLEITSHYEQVEGYYTIADPFPRPDPSVNPEPKGEPRTIFYNCFEIGGPPAIEQNFVRGWGQRASYQAQQEGFFSAFLHQHIDPGVRVAAFNRAEWQDMAAYARTMVEFDRRFPLQQRVTGGVGGPDAHPPVQSYMGLYRIVAAFQGAPQTSTQRMRAVVIEQYGGPEVLTYQETERPITGPGQILVRVHAVGVSPLDLKMRSGAVRTMYPLWPEDILGCDLAGTVEALGRGVTTFQIGEEVYGSAAPSVHHGYAEYAVVPATALQRKPRNLTFIQATALIPPLSDPTEGKQDDVRNQSVVDAEASREQGHLQAPEIGLVLPLSQAAQAHRLLEEGKVQGRVILEVA